MQALQTKLETLTNQNSDCKQHIDVLKESLNAKEQRANTLQTEVSATHTFSLGERHELQMHKQMFTDTAGLSLTSLILERLINGLGESRQSCHSVSSNSEFTPAGKGPACLAEIEEFK